MVDKIEKKLRRTGESYLIYNVKEDIRTVAQYCNMLAEKVNELIDENNRLSKELDAVRQIK